MPTVFRSRGFRFFFYANEGSPPEPPHIHVRQTDREAKLWLRPGLNTRELRDIRELIEANREQIERAWNEFFD